MLTPRQKDSVRQRATGRTREQAASELGIGASALDTNIYEATDRIGFGNNHDATFAWFARTQNRLPLEDHVSQERRPNQKDHSVEFKSTTPVKVEVEFAAWRGI